MLDFVLCASSNFFRIFLIDKFVEVFLVKAKASRKMKLFVCVCFYVINTTLFWVFHTAWVNIICNLIGISAIVGLYTKSIKTNIFVTSAIYLICAGCDVASTSLFVNYRDGQAHSQIYAVITDFLFLVCKFITEKIVTIHKNTEISHYFPLIFVPICSIMMIVSLIYLNVCTGIGITIVGIGLLILNFLMLYLYNQLLLYISQKYDTEMLRQKVQIYANQFDIILESEEIVKTLRHDMKHHMNELKLLANRYGASEIQNYINQMELFIHNPNEIVSSGNMEIDSVLNYMLKRAREELKTVNINVMLPEKIKHSFDINILLGNLLENAIEASVQTDKKYLSVNITLKRGVLKVKIENSFLASGIVQKEQKSGEKNFLTTKREKEQHGIGLKSVRKIVESYNGIMKVEPYDDIFCVKLILYMSKMENVS